MSKSTVEMTVHNKDGDTLQSVIWEMRGAHIPRPGERVSLGEHGRAAIVKDVLWSADLRTATITSKASVPAPDFFRFVESLVTAGVIALKEYTVVHLGGINADAESSNVG